MSEVSFQQTSNRSTLDAQAINTLRFLAIDAVEEAGSGHPGMPMGAAPMAYVLWQHYLRHHPADPAWPDRDRFVLSAGHGSMLLYALLHVTGYDLPLEELKNFRQWGSRTPGHPENFVTAGVETTTGPLGQGFANGVGMALAERHLAAVYNRPGHTVVDHHTYAIVSDGDLMEGVSHEAASLAGHQKLGKLIYLYDDNEISIDGSTELAYTEDVTGRFEAYGWHVQSVADGNDLEAIDSALHAAHEEEERPSLIRVRTRIGYGSPNQEGTAAVHGSPLGENEAALTRRNLGWPDDQRFYVPEEVQAHMKPTDVAYRGWHERWEAYRTTHPEPAGELKRRWDGQMPALELPEFEAGEKLATRASSGKVLAALAPQVPELLGGSADLTGSNKTRADSQIDMQPETPEGTYVRYGVREHGMAAACNGMAVHGGVRPYCGTFLIFSDYMRPSVRLSALMGAPVVYVFTHDSIGLGEDGPTHQPVEHLMALRAIPQLAVIRPADAREVAGAWRVALEATDHPTALALTRQKLPTLEGTSAESLRRGAYVLHESSAAPDLLLMASGSEVHVMVEAAEHLENEGVHARVVSVPSWELFDAQPEAYRRDVLPEDVPLRLSLEAGITMGWRRYLGPQGKPLGIDRFGASAPGEIVMQKFGFTPAHVLKEARTLLER